MLVNENLLQILSKVAPNRPINNVDMNKPLTQQGYDSLDISMLLFKVEEIYSITIPTSKVGDIRSIDDLTKYLNATLEDASNLAQ